MRRGRALILRVIEAIGVLLLVACIVAGVTITRASRVSETQSAAAKALAQARAHQLSPQAVAKAQTALKAGLTFVRAPAPSMSRPMRRSSSRLRPASSARFT